MSYKVTIEDIPVLNLAGLKTRVNIANAKEQCSALWKEFMDRREELKEIVEDSLYGISTNMTENGNFDYWAVVAVTPESTISPGMVYMTLPARKYAKCVSPLNDISKTFEFIYGEWAKTEKNFSVDFKASRFERYPKAFQGTDKVELFVPLS
ncbi:MAG: GyrI-like domain-containing protein [Azoarcus sp.]|jgi:predicted transcriptional regulator YdeE|nr:GyrI-like domain-containing protein [Azoarcus sp.]